MNRAASWVTLCALACAACGRSQRAATSEPTYATTAGAIALANLEQQIAQAPGDAARTDFLLVRSQLLGDYEALDRASRIAERGAGTPDDRMRRAKARAAVHRFADALQDVDAAERAGARPRQTAALRASILVATGHARDVLAQLEADAVAHPGFASRSALAAAYAAVGRFAEADTLYARALADLDTTLPFPYAWVYFARGVMWTDQAHDSTRGATFYARALAHVPEFVAANIHLAEIEAARGQVRPAMARLERVTASSDEPEAVALLGVLHVRAGERDRGRREIAHARGRFELLLRQHALAFADHAAEFYLGAGADAERAWTLAAQNLANRETPRAFMLAIKAARASGRDADARALVARVTGAAPATPRRPPSVQRARTARRA